MILWHLPDSYGHPGEEVSLRPLYMVTDVGDKALCTSRVSPGNLREGGESPAVTQLLEGRAVMSRFDAISPCHK